ncbi:hypothetical protein BHE74_00019651, partial [Ensete ventricosum]
RITEEPKLICNLSKQIDREHCWKKLLCRLPVPVISVGNLTWGRQWVDAHGGIHRPSLAFRRAKMGGKGPCYWLSICVSIEGGTPNLKI